MLFGQVFNFNRVLVLCLLVFVATTVSFAGAIDINGTCELGNCAAPGILTSGQSTSASINFTYTFANTDSYHIFGSVAESNTNETISLSLGAVYLGNASGTTSQADALTISFLQDYAEGFTGTVSGFRENMSMYFYGPIAGTSSGTAQWSFDGQKLPLMSFAPSGPNSLSFTNITLSGLTEPLAGDWVQVFSFGQGSNVGATISGTAPEPSFTALLGVGLLAIASGIGRKRN